VQHNTAQIVIPYMRVHYHVSYLHA
jgi:hypothetical protein